MSPLWIIAAIAVLGSAAAAWWLRREEPAPTQVEVEEDEVGILKDRVEQHRELERDLVSAGQALGRVRKFLPDPQDGGVVVDALRERLSDIWLRRLDFEGRLRLAALRRRIPAPPAVAPFEQGSLSMDEANAVLEALHELAQGHRDVVERAEDSARIFRRLNPADDEHARWVGEAVTVATEWRGVQAEEILRLSARLAGHADRIDEVAVLVEEALQRATHESADTVSLTGLAERIRALARLGLDERQASELDQSPDAKADADAAITLAHAASIEARALARRAGSTRPPSG